MVAPTDSRIQECVTCGALLDVTAEEPFALMHCPNCGAAMRVRRHFDHFEIKEELGRGGMGTVYCALNMNLHRPVALKLLQQENSDDPAFVAQFEKEAATTASINHPHVVKVYSTGKDFGRVYIAMELVDKGSLESLMEAEGRVTEPQVLTVGIQIAQGLQAALEKGLIHRDIKPGNILFSNPGTAKIVDFGLAILAEHAGTVAGEVWATPFYVSPETVQGHPEDFRSDLYSLGATLFHALSGKPPHDVETNSMRELAEAKRATVSLQAVVPEVSSATAFALNKALRYEPGDRQQSYAEFIEHLEFARTAVAEAAAQAAAQAAAPVKTYGWLTALTTLLVVALGVGGFLWRDRLFPAPAAEVEEVPQTQEKIDAKYQEARKLLASGDATKAAAEFTRLDTQTAAPQPLRNWITLHAGLAELVAGRPEEARAHFAKIEERGVYSTDFAEEALSKWFIETARLGASTTPIAPDAVEKLDRGSFEALALLVGGLRDWSLGDYENATALLQQFKASTPLDRHAWVAAYQPLITPYLAEIADFRVATSTAEAATNREARQQAVQTVRDTKKRIKLASALPAKLDALDQALTAKIAAEEAETARQLAAAEAADEQALAAARTQIAPLWAQFRPSECVTVAAAVKVTGPKATQARDTLRRRMEWLARFKSTLINDLNTGGYPSPLLKRTGATMPGPVKYANDREVEVVTPFGSLPAAWTELAPETIIAMAKTFLRPDFSPEVLADRQWQLGLYALAIGKAREGRDWLIQASQAHEEYRNDLSRFLEGPATP